MLCHGVARSMQIHFTRIQTSRLSVSFGVVALAALTAWALHLRVWQLGAQSLWIDEGFSVVHARAMLEHGGRPQLPGGATDWSAWPFHAVMAAVLRWQRRACPRPWPARCWCRRSSRSTSVGSARGVRRGWRPCSWRS
jgi:hypothetical protein